MILNTFMIGMLVFGLAQLEYVALQRWEEVAEIVARALADRLTVTSSAIPAMPCSPIWHAVLGGLVVLLGALQLWQDWDLSDQDLPTAIARQ